MTSTDIFHKIEQITISSIIPSSCMLPSIPSILRSLTLHSNDENMRPGIREWNACVPPIGRRLIGFNLRDCDKIRVSKRNPFTGIRP